MARDLIGKFYRFRADDMVYTAHDHLRCVDHCAVRRARITALTGRMGRIGKFVGPAEIVPVVHMQRQRDHILALGNLAQNFIGWRTAGTALRREQLNHNILRAGLKAQAHGNSSRERYKFRHINPSQFLC